MNVEKWTTFMIVSAVGMVLAAPGIVAAQNYGDPGLYNEEEWWDPSDWFDGDNYEYDLPADDTFTGEPENIYQNAPQSAPRGVIEQYADYGLYGEAPQNSSPYASGPIGQGAGAAYGGAGQGRLGGAIFLSLEPKGDIYEDDLGYSNAYDPLEDGYDYYKVEGDQSRRIFGTVMLTPRSANQPLRRTFNRPRNMQRNRQVRFDSQGTDLIMGRVVQVGLIEVRNINTDHVVARVNTRGSGTLLVDLGPPNQLGVFVEKGDLITARGDVRVKSKQPVLIAEYAHISGQTVNVSSNRRREWRRIQWMAQRRQQRQQMRRQREMQRRRQRQRQTSMRYQRMPGPRAAGRRGHRRVTVVAENMDYDPGAIPARPGQRLTITLINNGNHPHNIEFELIGGEVMFQQAVPPGQSRTLTFTVPTQSGRYIYYCPIANHRKRGMEGHLIVRS